MDLSEDELLAAVRKVLSGTGPDVVIGPGDDAAVVVPGTGQLVLSTDALVEGTHFRSGLSLPRDLGYKAIATSVSDMAAMAASPRWALCALTLSPAATAGWTMEVFGGMREACDEYALSLVGGNLSRGDGVSIVVTVAGEVAAGSAVRRSGARAGDIVVVTGRLGGAAAGLRFVLRGGPPRGEDERAAVVRFERPAARVGEARVLASNGATSMIDLSDGLALDLTRICEASGVGVRLDESAVPIAAAATAEEAMSGGEDYELLATLGNDEAVERSRRELDERFGVSLSEIGRIIEGERIVALPDGTERPLEAKGWDHLRDEP